MTLYILPLFITPLSVTLTIYVVAAEEQGEIEEMATKSISLFLPLFLLVLLSSCDRICGRQNHGNGNMNRSVFPRDFIFGVATSAYQIEGAYMENGKGLSNWDVFTHTPGNAPNGETGDIADDHYHLFMEDIEILHKLGVDAYRFSISWSRILPRGRFGVINPSGVNYYNKIIDNILLKGIEPYVTIHHTDFPQELEDRYGSWLSPQIQEDFVYFAKICFEEFGDRVKNWITVNEPNLNSFMSYTQGEYPPSHCSPPFGNCSSGNSNVEPLIAAHNMILSHAKAVQLYRDQFKPKQGGRICLVVCSYHYEPYRDDKYSYEAVERAYTFNTYWVLDPLVYGEYPALMHKYLGSNLPKFSKEEVKLVKGSLDFLGVNHYSTLYAIDCLHSSIDCPSSYNQPIMGFAYTTGYRDGIPIGKETGFERFFVVPYGMEKVINFLHRRYPNTTFYVTENGYNPLDNDNRLMDSDRIEFHEAYLAALAKAIRNGANVKGYFVWSLMDNFEWRQGYDATYGLYSVNRTTLERTPKQSAIWYADFLANKLPQNGRKAQI